MAKSDYEVKEGEKVRVYKDWRDDKYIALRREGEEPDFDEEPVVFVKAITPDGLTDIPVRASQVEEYEYVLNEYKENQ